MTRTALGASVEIQELTGGAPARSLTGPLLNREVNPVEIPSPDLARVQRIEQDKLVSREGQLLGCPSIGNTQKQDEYDWV